MLTKLIFAFEKHEITKQKANKLFATTSWFFFKKPLANSTLVISSRISILNLISIWTNNVVNLKQQLSSSKIRKICSKTLFSDWNKMFFFHVKILFFVFLMKFVEIEQNAWTINSHFFRLISITSFRDYSRFFSIEMFRRDFNFHQTAASVLFQFNRLFFAKYTKKISTTNSSKTTIDFFITLIWWTKLLKIHFCIEICCDFDWIIVQISNQISTKILND